MPKFTRPPLIEAILGVQFKPVSGLTNAHLGLYWKRLGADWKSAADMPLLDHQSEFFVEKGAWRPDMLGLRVTQEAHSRLQIRNSAKDRMIQVQRDRLHYNWLGEGGTGYLHYENLRHGFDETLRSFEEFIQEERFSDKLEPDLWEVVYLNHIPKGSVWEKPADWGKVLSAPFILPAPRNGEFETFDGTWKFLISKNRGRLYVQLRHGKVMHPKEQEVLVLTLTARGPVGPDQSVSDGLDLGHEAIVRGFAHITSPEAQHFWERTS